MSKAAAFEVNFNIKCEQDIQMTDKSFITWQLDSGSEVHICFFKGFFTNFIKFSSMISWGDEASTRIMSSGYGNMSMVRHIIYKPVILHLTHVRYIPQ